MDFEQELQWGHVVISRARYITIKLALTGPLPAPATWIPEYSFDKDAAAF